MTIALWITLSLATAAEPNNGNKSVQAQKELLNLAACLKDKKTTETEGCLPKNDPWGNPYQLIPSTNCESSQMLKSHGIDGISSQDDIEQCTTPPISMPNVLSPNLKSAEPLNRLTRKQVYWLKPLKQRLPQNPYQHVDFTAYSLEWGEALLGLNTLKIGILPRTQIGAKPLLWLVGLQNADAKINALRLGPVDIGIEGSYLGLASSEFPTTNIGVGAIASLQIMQPWSIHLQGNYNRFQAEGLPDLDTVNDYFLDFVGVDVDAIRDDLNDQGLNFGLGAETMTLNLTSDIRFNRRDSLIFQGKAIIWHRIDISNTIDETDLPIGVDLDSILSLESEGMTDISKNYLVSAAWQWSWDRAYLRLGIGWSSLDVAPYLPPILSTIDYAWRFGGKTKIKEGKIRKGWKNNITRLKEDPTENLPISLPIPEENKMESNEEKALEVPPAADQTETKQTDKTENDPALQPPQTTESNRPKEVAPRLRVKLNQINAFEAIISECGTMQSKTFNGSNRVQFENAPNELCTLQLLPMGAMIRIMGGDRSYECSLTPEGELSCREKKSP